LVYADRLSETEGCSPGPIRTGRRSACGSSEGVRRLLPCRLSPRKGRPQSTVRRASAGSDGTVRIWDRQTGEQHPTLGGHQDWVHGVCPVTVADRELLASAGDDCTMRIWGPQTRRRHGLVATGVTDSSESCGLGSLDRIDFGAPAAKAAVKASSAPVVSTACVPLARYRRVTSTAWMTQPDPRASRPWQRRARSLAWRQHRLRCGRRWRSRLRRWQTETDRSRDILARLDAARSIPSRA